VRLPSYSNDAAAILKEARALLRSFQDKKIPVRLIGLKISEVKKEPADQTSMSVWIEKKEEG
jgi:hypothetical protein